MPDDEHIVISTNRESLLQLIGQYGRVAFRNIAKRLLGEDIPLMNLDEEDTFITR